MVNTTVCPTPDKLKVVELRAELAARGLDTKGNKPVLIERLKKALEDEAKAQSGTNTEDATEDQGEEKASELKEPATEKEQTSPSGDELATATDNPAPSSADNNTSANEEPVSAADPVSQQAEAPSEAQSEERAVTPVSTREPAMEAENVEQSAEKHEELTPSPAADAEKKPESTDDAERKPESTEDAETKPGSAEDTEKKTESAEAGQTEVAGAEPASNSEDGTIDKAVEEDKPAEKQVESTESVNTDSETKPVETENPEQTVDEDMEKEEKDESLANASTIAVHGGGDETILNDSVLNQSAAVDSGETPETEEKVEESVQAMDSESTEPTASTVAASLDTESQTGVSGAVENTDASKAKVAEENVEPKEDKPVEKMETEESAVEQPGDKAETLKTENGVSADAKDATSQEDENRDETRRSPARKRDRSPSEPSDKRTREPSPELKDAPEDVPECDPNALVLDWYNSDLNLVLDKETLTSGSPLTEGGFVYAWAGARATYGFLKGKVCFEVKIVKHLEVQLPEGEVHPHLIRIGWSVDEPSLQLGESPLSYGYDSTGKFFVNSEYQEYGKTLKEGDVVGAYLNFGEEQITIEFTVNGETQGVASTLNTADMKDKALYPHVLTKNCHFEVNFGQKEEPWQSLLEQYVLAGKVALEDRVKGTEAPSSREECEIIMMCGLPSCGKSIWATKYAGEHPEKRYNILGTSTLIDRMKVDGKPRRSVYVGKWEALIEKCTRCVNTLLDIAAKRRRNYILDQTNVFPNAQRRKLSQFKSFQRRAVVLVPSNEDYLQRVTKREGEEGKTVPDSAVMEMKANFRVPEAGTTLFPVVEYVELAEAEAKELVKKYNEEGQKAAQNASPASKKPRTDRDRDQDRDSRHSSSKYNDRRRSPDRSDRRNSSSYRSNQPYNRDRRRDDYRPRDRYSSSYSSSRDYNDRRDRYGGGNNYRNQSGGYNSGGRSHGGYSSGKYGGGSQGGGQGYQQSYGGNYPSRGGNRGGGYNSGGYNSNSYGGSGYGNYGSANYSGNGAQSSAAGAGYGNYYQSGQGQYFQGNAAASGQGGSWASYGQQPPAAGTQQQTYSQGYRTSYGSAPK